MTTIERETAIWWTGLRAVSVLNVGLWIWTASAAPEWVYREAHLVCAGFYTAVCGFRSFFPRIDLERYVMVDHWLSSAALGRSMATLAEMCFTLQCALLLIQLGDAHGVPWLRPAGYAILPLIAAAQGFCWAGVITLDHLWHAVEEVLWAVMVATLAAGFLVVWPDAAGPARYLLPLGVVGCAIGGFVMLVIDVPMYLRRRRADRAAGATRLGFGEGLWDALRRREPTGAWGVWRREVTWMTPYFSAGVWLSLGMVWSPL